MKVRSIITLLVIAGMLGIAGAFWSGSGAWLGPVRMGEGGMSDGTRNIIMLLTLIGGIGAIFTGLTIRVFSRKILGVASLVFGAFMVPSLFQGNVLSILALGLLFLVGIGLLLSRPVEGT